MFSIQRAVARVAARKKRKAAPGASADNAGEDKEGENWESVEPMEEVLDGGGTNESAADEQDRYGELDQSSDNPVNLR